MYLFFETGKYASVRECVINYSNIRVHRDWFCIWSFEEKCTENNIVGAVDVMAVSCGWEQVLHLYFVDKHCIFVEPHLIYTRLITAFYKISYSTRDDDLSSDGSTCPEDKYYTIYYRFINFVVIRP